MRSYDEMMLWYQGTLELKPSFERRKRFLIKFKGPECWECKWVGKNRFTDTWVIDLDHIDGDHSNIQPSNLLLLCPNCHALTSTYKSLNTKRAKEGRGPYVPLKGEIDF